LPFARPTASARFATRGQLMDDRGHSPVLKPPRRSGPACPRARGIHGRPKAKEHLFLLHGRAGGPVAGRYVSIPSPRLTRRKTGRAIKMHFPPNAVHPATTASTKGPRPRRGGSFSAAKTAHFRSASYFHTSAGLRRWTWAIVRSMVPPTSPSNANRKICSAYRLPNSRASRSLGSWVT